MSKMLKSVNLLVSERVPINVACLHNPNFFFFFFFFLSITKVSLLSGCALRRVTVCHPAAGL